MTPARHGKVEAECTHLRCELLVRPLPGFGTKVPFTPTRPRGDDAPVRARPRLNEGLFCVVFACLAATPVSAAEAPADTESDEPAPAQPAADRGAKGYRDLLTDDEDGSSTSASSSTRAPC
jgi:hypothetical protein